jgi:cardiolipin-specific phospholipase
MATATMTYAERSTLEVPSLPEPPATSRTPSLSSIAAAQSEINSESRSHSASPAPPIPTDFRSSLSAWWASSGYRDARIAEDRLLRRMSFYRPEQAEMAKSSPLAGAATPAEDVPVPAPSDTGLVATLRSVFIPTPDPKLAPLHPSDKPQPASAEGSESTSLSSQEKKKRNRMSLHRRKSDDSSKEKLVDYINTLEISREDLAGSKEAVVVVHGSAAAWG